MCVVIVILTRCVFMLQTLQSFIKFRRIELSLVLPLKLHKNSLKLASDVSRPFVNLAQNICIKSQFLTNVVPVFNDIMTAEEFG